MTDRDQSILKLTDLKKKLAHLEFLNKAVEDGQLQQKRVPSYVPLTASDLLPTDSANKYLYMQLKSVADHSKLKAVLVKILFWLVGIGIVLAAGYFPVMKLIELKVLWPLAFPGLLLVSGLIAFLDIKFDWEHKVKILLVCIAVFGLSGHFTHIYLGFSFWIFLAAIAVAIGLIAFCMHHNGWEFKFRYRNRKKRRLEDVVRKSPEFLEKAEQDRINRNENEIRKKEHRAAYERGLEEHNARLLAKIRAYAQEREALDQEIKSNGILLQKDFDKIDRLLQRLQEYRADTIKEALNQCDDDDRALQRLIADTDRKIFEQKMATERERERQWEQWAHQQTVEREQRRQADELERIRKALED